MKRLFSIVIVVLFSQFHLLSAIAASDGDIEPEEVKLLDFVKSEWGV